MLGGIKTAESCGLEVPHREAIWAALSAMPEGHLFRADDVSGDDAAVEADFQRLRGHDHHHVTDGWFTPVVETAYLRRAPKTELLLAAYSELRGSTLVETGDRSAWRCGFKRWEPVLGYRFYTDGADEVLSVGRHMRIRIPNAPDWLRADGAEARLLRILHDTPAKEVDASLDRAAATAVVVKTSLDHVLDHARSIGPITDEEKVRWPWLRCPIDLAVLVDAWIARSTPDGE